MSRNKQLKRYQELGKPYRIILWLRYMPFGYVKALAWYFIKRLKWEDVSDDEKGRVTLGTCIGICVGMEQGHMRWYYTAEEIFGEDGELIRCINEEGLLERIGNFLENKFVDMIDGKVVVG